MDAAARSNSWTEHEDSELRRMCGEGASFRSIGARIGRTKNAAIGRALRLGLKQMVLEPKRKSALATPPQPKPPKPKLNYGYGSKHNQTPPEIIAARKQAAIEQAAAVTSPPPACDQNIPRKQRRSLFELDNSTCRWPVGDVGSPSFFFCGGMANNADGRIYCAHHMHAAFPYRRT